jgi:hypothetical protein
MEQCLYHYHPQPCPQCTENNTRGYQVKQLAGRCANGLEGGHGSKWHAVKNGEALCGAKPGRRSVGWSEYQILGQLITCPKCLKRVGK